MSLTFRDGFFPFPLCDDANVTPLYPSPLYQSFFQEISGLPLTTLCRLWWLSKGCGWEVNIAYGGGGSSGALTGSGTWNIAQRSAIISGTPLGSIWTIPAQRATTSRSTPSTLWQPGLPVGYDSTSGAINLMSCTDAGTISGGASWSNAVTLHPQWFSNYLNPAAFSPLVGSPYNAVVTKKSDGTYKTIFGMNQFNVGPGLSGLLQGLAMGTALDTIIDPTDGSVVWYPLSGLTCTIKITGWPDIVLPIYENIDTSDAWAGFMSGGMTLNFNSWWTP